MRKLKKFLIVNIFLVISILSFGAGEDLRDYKSLLIGDINGKITKADNIYDTRPFASITKMMTSLLVLEKVENGEISLSDEVFISSKAASIPYGVKLIPGNTYTVRDLLKATIIRSSNNAAYALGEYIGNGDVSSFVKMMNNKAKELGLESLRYCTPHGLPPSYTGTCMDQGNAYDLYKLATVVAKYDTYLNISKNANGALSDGTALKSTNNLLGKVRGVDGLKTGYHNAAGSNIILTSKRGNDRMIAVILGSQKAKNRDAIGENQIENYYNGGNKITVSKVTLPTGMNNREKNTRTNENVNKEDTLHMSKEGIVKIIDKNIAIGKIKINNKDYGLYSVDDIFTISSSGTKVNLSYEISIKDDITKKDNGKVVGTFIATDQVNIYTGGVILKEIK